MAFDDPVRTDDADFQGSHGRMQMAADEKYMVNSGACALCWPSAQGRVNAITKLTHYQLIEE
jgi:hypothetical protein